MTVSAAPNYNISIGNAVTTIFSYGFRILASSHLKVYLDGVLQSAGYTVGGVGAAGGGTVTFSAPPANGAEVLLQRSVPNTRTTDYVDNGDFTAADIDNDQDLQTMQTQDVSARVDRAVLVEVGETPPSATSFLQSITDGIAAAASAVAAAAAALVSQIAAAASAAAAALSASNAAAAASAIGPTLFYNTYALALADIASIPANGIIEVFVDETHGAERTIYRKESGVLVFKVYAGRPNKDGAGLGAAARKVKGIMSMIGDSTTDNISGRPAWQGWCDLEWFGTGGALEGWTNYNIGNNGSRLAEWATSTLSGNAGTPVTTRGNAWAAVNADPDIIVISLGLNDERTPALRASDGTLANMRANMATLVNFLLANCKASIWLRMPNPMAFSPATFSEAWANAAEAQAANAIIATTYRDWIGLHDRVEVFDTHRVTFNAEYANNVTDPVDPYGGGALLEDSLHPSDVGFRRIVQGMTKQVRNNDPLSPVKRIVAQVPFRNAAWSRNVWVQNIENAAGSDLISLTGNPQALLIGATAISGISVATDISFDRTPKKWTERTEDFYINNNVAILKDLLALAGRRGPFKLYSHRTGTIYTINTFDLSSTITNPGGDTYSKFFLNNGAGLTLAGVDRTEGMFTFYVEQPWQQPGFQEHPIRCAMTPGEADDFVGLLNLDGLGIEIKNGIATRKIVAGVGGSCEVFLITANNGVVVGTRIGAFTIGAGLAYATFVVDAVNYPAGVVRIAAANPGASYMLRIGTKVNFNVGTVTLYARPYLDAP